MKLLLLILSVILGAAVLTLTFVDIHSKYIPVLLLIEVISLYCVIGIDNIKTA